MSDKHQLTPVEHELMEILWRLGEGTVREVLANLPVNRQLAYTSVSTILRILEQKKVLRAIKDGKQHIYRPLLSKEVFATHTVNSVVKQIFAGKSSDLVAYLVDNTDLTAADIDALHEMLENKKKELK
jgi:predicted transcriptional regulator